MILKYWPKAFALEAVIVYCFNRDNKLVVLQKTLQDILYPGLWGTVAGKIKRGENKFSAGKREIWEETGNEVSQESLIYLNKSFPCRHHVHATGEPIIFLAHMLLYLQVFEGITLSAEHQKHYWVDPADILAEKFNCIPDAVDNLIECIPIIRKFKSIKT